MTSRGNAPSATWLALATVYVVWGSTYLAIAVVIESMPPLLGLGTRFIAAALILGITLTLARGPAVLRVTRVEAMGSALIGFLLLGCGIGILTLAERYVPTGVAALIVAVVPSWIVLLRLTDGQRPHLWTWLGVVVGLVGVAVLLRPGTASTPDNTTSIWGLAVVFGSACWALGSFITPRLSLPANAFTLTTYEMLFGGLVLCLAGLARGERINGAVLDDATMRSWTAWLYLVLIGSIVAYSAYVWLLGTAPLSLVATYAYVNPVVAVLLGALVLGESLTANVVVGGAIVVGGVALVVSGERSPQLEKAADR